MESSKVFKLEAGDLPARKRWGLYDEIISDFKKSDSQAAKIVIPDKPYKTLQIGLAKALQVSNQAKLFGVTIRSGDVWIFRR